jgi:membrane protease YdiL (CAAX protease family)
MMKSIWAGNTPYSKFLITVGIILISAVFFTLLSTVAATFAFDVNMIQLQAMLSDPKNPESLKILKLIQTFSAIGTFIIPPFILAYLFSSQPIEYLALNKQPRKNSYIIIIALMLIATPFINFLGELNSHLHLPSFLKGVEDWMHDAEAKAAELTEAFLIMNSFGDLLFNIFMIALLPAIGEELLFRGIVQKLFHQWTRNAHIAIWLTAILFSAMHMQFYGFLPRMILGVMLGYMLVWSGSLWLPILAHFINNAGAVIFTYMFQHGYTNLDPDKVGTENDFISVLGSIVITFLLFSMLYKKRVYSSFENVV